MDWQVYPHYKDSGVSWLGTIPEHWEMERVKSSFRLRTELSGLSHGKELLSVYTHIGVKPRKELEQKGNRASTTDDYWVVNSGDIVANKLLAWMGAIGVSEYEGVTSPAYDILKPIKSLDAFYYHYLFRSPLYLAEFKRRSRGIMEMRLRLYFDQFGQVLIPVPPLEEQSAIVRFIRYMDQRVNRLIKAKRRLLELLNEQKQAIVYRAVTRGTNPSAALKETRTAWLGSVPAHWDVSRLKTKLIRNDGGAWGADDSESGTIVLRSTEQTVDGGWRIENPARRTLSDTERMETKLLAGDLLLTKSSGSSAHIGKTSLVDEKIEAMECGYSNFMQRLRCSDQVSPTFIWRCLNNPVARVQFVHFSNSTTGLGNLTGTIVGNLWLAFPPLAEQLEIERFIVSETRTLETAIQRTNAEIGLIREYRSRLIADVICGQVDVRNLDFPGFIDPEVEQRLETDAEEEQDLLEVLA